MVVEVMVGVRVWAERWDMVVMIVSRLWCVAHRPGMSMMVMDI